MCRILTGRDGTGRMCILGSGEQSHKPGRCRERSGMDEESGLASATIESIVVTTLQMPQENTVGL